MTTQRLPSFVRRSRTMLAASAVFAALIASAALPAAATRALPAATTAAIA